MTRAVLALALLALPGAATLRAQTTSDAAPAPEGSRGNVVAVVNGEPLYFEDLERTLERMHEGASAAQRRAPDLDLMMFRLVNDTLLAQEARALGMDDEEPIPSRLAAKRESLAVARLEKEEIWNRAEPSDDEIEKTFADAYQTLTFRSLTVHERERAEVLGKELGGGADFARLAKEHSVDPYAPREGLVEDLAKINMPLELAAVAFTLKPGEVEGPIATRIGWSIIRAESIAPADPGRLPELRPSVRALVRFRKAEALRDDLRARLREAHPVSVDEAALLAVAVDHLPDGRLVPKVEHPDAVVARVGERTITAAELGVALRSRWAGVGNEEAASAARPIVLDRLVRAEVMTAEALARGYGDALDVQRALHATQTQLLVSRYLRGVVAADVAVRPEEMKAYYEEHKEGFHRPPRLQLRQVTVESEEEARRLLELLKSGTDIAWLARRHSIDGFKGAGGDRGWVVAGRNGGPFRDALFEARPGDVLGPEEAGEGFVVAQVGAREEQGVYAFDEVSGNVRKAVEAAKTQDAIHRFVQTLRSRSTIEIHQDVVAAMEITARPDVGASHSADVPPDHPR